MGYGYNGDFQVIKYNYNISMGCGSSSSFLLEV